MKRTSYLNLTSDAAFKAYFSRNRGPLKHLLQTFLPLPEGGEIIDIKMKNPNLLSSKSSSSDGVIDGKTFILDMLVEFKLIKDKDEVRNHVNVEMQTSIHPHFTDRILAYTARTYSEQIKKGDDYSKLKPVYSLAFTTANLDEFWEYPKEHYHLCSIRKEAAPGRPEPVLSHKIKLLVVELGKFDLGVEKLDNVLDKWAFLLKNSSTLDEREARILAEGDENMAIALKKLEETSRDEDLQAELRSIEKFKMDMAAIKQDAVDKAEARGEAKAKKEVVVEMFKEGMDISLICKITKLPKEKVTELSKGGKGGR